MHKTRELVSKKEREWMRVWVWVWVWQCICVRVCVGGFLCLCVCVRANGWWNTQEVSHTNESCQKYERVMCHIWTSHVTHMNESFLTHERVMPHVWMSHVTHVNPSYHTHMNTSKPARSRRANDPRQRNIYVWYDSFICVTWLSHMCGATCAISHITHMNTSKPARCRHAKDARKRDVLVWVVWLIRICDMTRSYVWHDLFKKS